MNQKLHQGRFLELCQTEQGWEYCARVNDTGAVMIFTHTQDDCIILVEEYRPPIGKQSICFPAGLSGDAGPESDLIAAQRELLEETGYAANHWQFLFDGPSSPGLSSEMLSFYLARDMVQVEQGGGVEGENILVHKIALHEIDWWLAKQMEQGKSIDPRVYTGLYFIRTCQAGQALL